MPIFLENIDGLNKNTEKLFPASPKPLLCRKSSVSSSILSHGCFKWQQGNIIGKGRFGCVYTGINMLSGEIIAVKEICLKNIVVDNDLMVEEQQLERIKTEVDLLQKIQEESAFIFMEYVPGGSVLNIVESIGSLEENIVRCLLKQLLEAVAFLHAKRIAHRDLKCANLLLTDDGIVKLADFGASKRVLNENVLDGTLDTIKSARQGVGSPYWMSPEQVKAENNPDFWRKVDIWGIGCVFIEMATGAPPWSKYSNPMAVMYNIASSNAIPEYPKNLSQEAYDFLDCCFQRNSRLRSTADELKLHPFLLKQTSLKNDPCIQSTNSIAQKEISISPTKKSIQVQQHEDDTQSFVISKLTIPSWHDKNYNLKPLKKTYSALNSVATTSTVNPISTIPIPTPTPSTPNPTPPSPSPLPTPFTSTPYPSTFTPSKGFPTCKSFFSSTFSIASSLETKQHNDMQFGIVPNLLVSSSSSFNEKEKIPFRECSIAVLPLGKTDNSSLSFSKSFIENKKESDEFDQHVLVPKVTLTPIERTTNTSKFIKSPVALEIQKPKIKENPDSQLQEKVDVFSTKSKNQVQQKSIQLVNHSSSSLSLATSTLSASASNTLDLSNPSSIHHELSIPRKKMARNQVIEMITPSINSSSSNNRNSNSSSLLDHEEKNNHHPHETRQSNDATEDNGLTGEDFFLNSVTISILKWWLELSKVLIFSKQLNSLCGFQMIKDQIFTTKPTFQSIVVRIVANYFPQRKEELYLYESEYVEVLEMEENGWWKGKNASGAIGWFPCTYSEWIDIDEMCKYNPSDDSYLARTGNAVQNNKWNNNTINHETSNNNTSNNNILNNNILNNNILNNNTLSNKTLSNKTLSNRTLSNKITNNKNTSEISLNNSSLSNKILQEEDSVQGSLTDRMNIEPQQWWSSLNSRDGTHQSENEQELELAHHSNNFVRVLAFYERNDEIELSLRESETLEVLLIDDSGWWKGRNCLQQIGWFPCTYVEWIEESRSSETFFDSFRTNSSSDIKYYSDDDYAENSSDIVKFETLEDIDAWLQSKN